MSHAMTRAERLQEMERLYLLRAYTDSDLADRLGVDRTTVYRDRIELEGRMPIYQDADGRYRIDRSSYISSLRVNLAEALSLYLAARRTAQQTRLAQRHVASAIEKLSVALHQPMTERLVRAADAVLAQREDISRAAVFATVATAWAETRRLKLTYRALRDGTTRTHRFEPYLLEPSPWSDGVYLIGRSDLAQRVITLKLDRIIQADLMGPFEPPSDFDEDALLRHAWGIWGGEDAPETVVLRFAPGQAARRLKESVWHPLETVTDLEDGGCRWEAPIAEWQEMLPWIRGWGAEVEVIAPRELRDTAAASARQQAVVYDVVTGQPDLDSRILQLWGKAAGGAFHPALYHMLDVGHIAYQLLSSQASPRWRRVLAAALGIDPDRLRAWLPWIVALHDLGKVSAPFQAQVPEQRARLEREGFPFPRSVAGAGYALHHTTLGRLTLANALGLDPLSPLLTMAMEMVLGHHGVFGQVTRTQRTEFQALREPVEWDRLRQRTAALLGVFLQSEPVPPINPPNLSAAIMALTGFTILCDWLGSDSRFFRCAAGTNLVDYVGLSRQQATSAVAAAGFDKPVRGHRSTDFNALFPELVPARPLQRAVDDLPDPLFEQPVLVIVEAPTGEGKTEAALALAHRIAARQDSDELYVALPTTATSNQMYLRVQRHLRDRLGLPAIAKLVHGQAFLVEDDLLLEALMNGDPRDDASLAQAALTWFGPKKRALLAPFGVGTIDQAELAALNVRHNALRMIGLAGKVVILDEVHAYDAYMSYIIERMLSWLAALGTSVVLLSATLPQARRSALAAAYGIDLASAGTDGYPAILAGSAGQLVQITPAAHQPDRQIELHRLRVVAGEGSIQAAWLLAQVADGGCACWIANTVAEAQAIYGHLQALAGPDTDVTLIHARFPVEDRQRLEEKINRQYGPQGERPPRGIVVGTQVLEQSLDLDFDVMATTLAPVDLILQRAGRLHRHSHRQRPASHQTPRLWLAVDLDDQAIPRIRQQRVYDKYLLLRSWDALEACTHLRLPADYRGLVEFVYSESPAGLDALRQELWRDLERERARQQQEAELRLAPKPDPAFPFSQAPNVTFREDEDSNAWMVAQTRLGQESITVIPLARDGALARLTPLPETVALDAPAERAVQLRLLRRSIRVSHPIVVAALKSSAGDAPQLFRASPLLCHCLPLWLAPNHTVLTHEGRAVTVVFDPIMGLRFSSQGE